MFVSAINPYRGCVAAVIAAFALGFGQLEHFVVVELLFEILAVGEEVEELEGGFDGLLHAFFNGVVEKQLAEVVPARATSLDLDEVGRRKNRPEQAEIENVRAVIAGGHHAHGDADARLAGFVSRDEVGRAEQVVVGEVDGELLGVLNLRGDLHGEVGLVFGRIHAVGHLVEDLRQLGGVVLADGKDDRLADLAADRIAQGIFQKRLAEKLVGGVGEKALLELALLEGLLLVIAGVIGDGDDEALFRKQFGGDLGAGVHHGRVDQEAFLHAIEQGVAEGGLAVLAAEGAVGVEQQATLGFARVAGALL